MEVLEQHSREDALITLFDCADGSLILRNLFFGGRGVHNEIFLHLIHSIVELHVHDNSLYYHATSGIYVHNLFKVLFNCFYVWVGMCLTVKNCIPHDMAINNGALFTNITSDTRVTNFFNFKRSLGTEK